MLFETEYINNTHDQEAVIYFLFFLCAEIIHS